MSEFRKPGGYLIAEENHAALERGFPSSELLASYAVTEPPFNIQADPMGVVTIEDQLNIGACVGNSGSSVVEACYFIQTGRKIQLSRAAAYYLSQKADGIRGDKGATLSGFREVATNHGLCLESAWPYPKSYNPKQPPSAAGQFNFRVTASAPLKTFDAFDSWIRRGLPVHVGMGWNDSCEKPVVDRYRGGGGGHALMFWLMQGDNYRQFNSWGSDWQGRGWNVWTPNAIRKLLSDQWAVLVGYGPAGMSFPTPDPIG